MSRGEEVAVVRRGRVDDLDQILDLLAFYDRPRDYFEPFYKNDPTYRPGHSWIFEERGRLLAHLRVFDREVWAHGERLRVAAVGNVITAPEGRGRGYAGRLLEEMLKTLPAEGFAYSLLRAYRPTLYERHGWAPIDQEFARTQLRPSESGAVERFGEDALADTMRIYDANNAGRTGPTVRPPDCWRGQLRWLEEDREGFLIFRRDNSPLGYVRSRVRDGVAEVLELGTEPGDSEVGGALLSAVAARSGGRMEGYLPPSLRDSLLPNAEAVDVFGLMGRVTDLDALVASLGPAWSRRVRESGGRDGTLRLSVGGGLAEVRVGADGVEVGAGRGGETAGALDERAFAHLLFRGFDAAAESLLGGRPDAALLRVLFPAQDFVIWRSDVF